MTPLEIEVLLHYYSSPVDHPNKTTEAVNDIIDKFITAGIFKLSRDVLVTTDRGKKLVVMLCETPFPEQVYVDPRFHDRESTN